MEMLATAPTIEAAPEAAKKKKSRGQRGMGNVYVHRKNYWLDVRANGQRHRVSAWNAQFHGPLSVIGEREQAGSTRAFTVPRLADVRRCGPLPGGRGCGACTKPARELL